MGISHEFRGRIGRTVAESEPSFEQAPHPGEDAPNVFIVLLAPESAGGLHLKALARISRLFSDPSFHSRLLKAGDRDEVYSELAAEEERY